MSDFLNVLDKIYPLYLMVGLGFIAGKFLNACRTTISSLLIYIVTPLVVFNGVATAPHDNSYLLLPVVFYAVACFLSISFYNIGGLFWRTSERNLLGFIAGTGNTGYFGIPLIIALFGSSGLSIAVFATLGKILYESTLGYYLIAKCHATAKDAAYKVLKAPILYAFLLGIAVNRLDVHFPDSLATNLSNFGGAYTVLGMMILGIGLATVTRGTFDKTFTYIGFAAKFLAYPALMGLLVYLDISVLHLFGNEVHKVMMILAIAPMAANAVTYATYLKAHPEKTAFTVTLSTLFGLLYIPLFISLFLK